MILTNHNPSDTQNKDLEKFIKQVIDYDFMKSYPRQLYPYPEKITRPRFKALYQCLVQQKGIAYVDDDAIIDKAITNIAQWLCNPLTKPFLMLSGPLGSGKSTMMETIKIMLDYDYFSDPRKPYLEPHQRPPLLPATEIYAIRTTSNDHKKFDNICRQSIIYIDDFGLEPSSGLHYGTTVTPLSELFYSRYNSRKPTIFTTNLSNHEIQANYGERLIDRFREMVRIVNFSGTTVSRDRLTPRQ